MMKPLVPEQPGTTCSFSIMEKKEKKEKEQKRTETFQSYHSFIPHNNHFSKQDTSAWEVLYNMFTLYHLATKFVSSFQIMRTCLEISLWTTQSDAVKLQQHIVINTINKAVPIVQTRDSRGHWGSANGYFEDQCI